MLHIVRDRLKEKVPRSLAALNPETVNQKVECYRHCYPSLHQTTREILRGEMLFDAQRYSNQKPFALNDRARSLPLPCLYVLIRAAALLDGLVER